MKRLKVIFARQASNCSLECEKHVILILDKELHGIPWESMPCLRGKSVSRLPSFAFLNDRNLMLKNPRPYGYQSNSRAGSLAVDRTKLWYVLNPGGDLVGTEQRFNSLLQRFVGDCIANEISHSDPNWQGIVGRWPSEDNFCEKLRSQQIFV